LLILVRHLFRVPRPVFLIPLVVAALVPPRSLNAEPSDGLGMWVWSKSAYSSQDARQRLVQFSFRHHITHLDVHTKISPGEGKPALQNAEAFRDLILLAGQYHITTAALRGDPKMFFSENHARALGELRAIIAFSQTLPPNSGLEGIKYDVEPYLTKEWKLKGESRERVMRDYLDFLRKARSVLKEEAPHLWLAGLRGPKEAIQRARAGSDGLHHHHVLPAQLSGGLEMCVRGKDVCPTDSKSHHPVP
jgi:hypothetical protein